MVISSKRTPARGKFRIARDSGGIPSQREILCIDMVR